MIRVIFLCLFCFCAIAVGAKDPHFHLKEVEVRPKKEKYSKKNNPAVDFVRRVMECRNMTDPRQTNPYYSHGSYERINLGLINFNADSTDVLSFLSEYVDTTELTGRPVLNVSVKEKVSDVYYQREPQRRREVVRLRNRNGLDEMLGNAESLQAIYDDLLRQVDLYDANDITLLRQKFVSPLGRIAPDFYKFYLTDTIADAAHGDSLVVLSFMPRNASMPSFNGHIYVVKDDSAMFIRRAELRMPHNSNVNFISDMALVQEYERAPDGSRLKQRDEVIIEACYAGIDVYFSRLTVNNSHSFKEPKDLTMFNREAEVIELNDLGASIASYRPAGTQRGSADMGSMMERLRGNTTFYRLERVVAALVSNYIRPGGATAPVALGPIFSVVNHNGLEGWRVRLGGMTTAHLNNRFFVGGYGAYGFKDKKWKYKGEIEYSFIDKKEHKEEFPIRSIRLSHSYDIDRLGQHYSASGTVFNSLARTDNHLMTYNRETALKFTYETAGHMTFSAGLSHCRQEESAYVPFIDGYGTRHPSFQQTAIQIGFRYAPHELYYQNMNIRYEVTSEYPVISVSHTYAPGGLFGTRWGVNKTEVSVSKRQYFSAWGHLDACLGAGHVWGETVFTSLLMPNANLSYFYQPRAFSLLDPMEFINDSYVELHLNYNANGALLNYIPLVKRLNLRELVGFHAIWGNLSDRNNPALNPSLLQLPEGVEVRKMGKTPYMEFNVGIGNIFRILSIQYVHRITHRSSATAKNGVRVMFQFSF